jgi:hypothetical protein
MAGERRNKGKLLKLLQQGPAKYIRRENAMEDKIMKTAETAGIQVMEKEEGKHIDYQVTSKKITFGDDELTINLASRERDYETVLDICLDIEDGLVIGVGDNAKKYVAQVVIPARAYETVEGEVVMEMGEGQQEGEGRHQTVSVPVPFDMKKCTLILWKMEG